MQTQFGTGSTSKDSSELAFTDPLTGLGNHRRFSDKVERLISDRSDDPAPFAVGIIDLDGFNTRQATTY
jgi:GGDEF domain-containing protein